MSGNKLHRIAGLAVAGLTLALWLAVASPAMAKSRDRNHDGLPDRWEKRHHLSLKVNEARRDQDRDGLNNRKEFKFGTDPRDADTDNDGLDDGDEVEVGDNPRDGDSDNDGVEDGEENAGTVASFDQSTGVLTISLFDGSSVTGQVTDATEIECDNEGDGGEAEASSDSGDCTAADLTPGALVHEAELETTPTGLVYESVELAG
jgi:hypothetical protein